MMKKPFLYPLFVFAALLIVSAQGCGLFRPAATATPTPLPSATPAPSAPWMALSLPNGETLSLDVTRCKGVAQGNAYTLEASSPAGIAASNQARVAISGISSGPGEVDNLTIAITLGDAANPLFQGSSQATTFVLKADGSGRFHAQSLTNTATSASYDYGTPYTFSAEWICNP
jgi:hypothetical protein